MELFSKLYVISAILSLQLNHRWMMKSIGLTQSPCGTPMFVFVFQSVCELNIMFPSCKELCWLGTQLE